MDQETIRSPEPQIHFDGSKYCYVTSMYRQISNRYSTIWRLRKYGKLWKI